MNAVIMALIVLVMSGSTTLALHQFPVETGRCIPNTDAFRFPCFPNNNETYAIMDDIAQRSKGRVTVELAGYSVEGRPLKYLVLNKNRRHQLPSFELAGRTHGDECVGTRAILDLFEWIIGNTPSARQTRNSIVLIGIPIYNIDGSYYTRRTSSPVAGFPSGIDPNRDSVTIGVVAGPGSSNFVLPETNAWYNVTMTYKPDYINDIHMYFDNSSLAGVQQGVDVQWVHFVPSTIPDDNGFYPNVHAVYRSYQLTQLGHDAIPDTITANYNMAPAAPFPPSSWTWRHLADSRKYVDDPVWRPKASVGIELRRVCPSKIPFMEQLAYKIIRAQTIGIATGAVEQVHPIWTSLVPVTTSAPCDDYSICSL